MRNAFAPCVGFANFFFQIYGVCIFASHAIPDTQGAAVETKKAGAFLF
jgi:hypothetical protein